MLKKPPAGSAKKSSGLNGASCCQTRVSSSAISASVRSISPALIDDVVFGAASHTAGAAADGRLLGVGVAASAGAGPSQIRASGLWVGTKVFAANDVWAVGERGVALHYTFTGSGATPTLS